MFPPRSHSTLSPDLYFILRNNNLNLRFVILQKISILVDKKTIFLGNLLVYDLVCMEIYMLDKPQRRMKYLVL